MKPLIAHMHSATPNTLEQLRVYTLIHLSWAACGSLLKFRLYDFNDYDDDWERFWILTGD